jgi:hypothetical protein
MGAQADNKGAHGALLYWGLLLVFVCFAARFAKPMFSMALQEKRSRTQNLLWHKQCYETRIRPTAVWVESFLFEKKRLPNQAELDSFTETQFPECPLVIYTNAPSSEPPWPAPGCDFMLCMPTGDWALYYRSYDKREFSYWTD